MIREASWLLPLLQGTACIAMGLTASYLLRRRAARAHQLLLTALLMSVLTPGLHLFVGHYELGVLTPKSAPPSPQEASGPTIAANDEILRFHAVEGVFDPAVPEAIDPSGLAPSHATAANGRPWSRVFLVCWAIATSLLLGRVTMQFVLGIRLVRASDPLENVQLRQALDAARARLGIGGSVHVRSSDRVQSPVIWCWAKRPILLLHREAPHQTRADWQSIFRHELAHWKRLDHASGLLAEVLTALLPWHPLLWWARARLSELSERACDDWALAGGTPGADYAESLLNLTPEGRMSFLPTVVGKEKAMKERIRRIIRDGCGNPRIDTRWELLIGCLAVLVAVGTALAQERPVRERLDRDEVHHQRAELQMVASLRREALEQIRQQLMDQIREREMRLHERGEEEMGPQDRQVLQFQLELLHEQMEQLERRLHDQEMESRRRLPERGEALDRMRAERQELHRHAGEIERELRGLGDNHEEEARHLREHLREIEENIGRMETDIANVEREGQREDPRGHMMRRLHDLRAQAPLLRGELAAMRDQDSDRAGELRRHLENIHNEMAEIEVNLQRLEGERRETERPRRDMPQERKRELERRLEELMAEIGETENALHRQEERGQGNSDEAQELREALGHKHAEARRIEWALQGNRRPPVAERREEVIVREHSDQRLMMEVEELRGQVRNLHEQMREMRMLLEQVVERTRPPELLDVPEGQ